MAADIDLLSQERSDSEKLIGSLVNERYQIDSVIGSGGMGVVYRAHHIHISQVVALKMLLPDGRADAQAFRRFQQEAKAASRLNHPGIVKIQDFGVLASDKAYLAMDYVEGKSLASILRAEGPMTGARLINIFIQSCEALEHAHAHGVVHRDIKPSNIMLVDRDGVEDHVVIVDFGLVKLMGANEEQPKDQKLTTTNTLVGSPLYMSPEQCRGLDLDHRTDIYSIGCCMYEALTGRTPLSGENPLDTLYKHVAEKPLPLRSVNPNLLVPAQLEKIVMQALEKNSEDRQQSMAELSQALRAVQGGGCHTTSTVSVSMPTQQSALQFSALQPTQQMVDVVKSAPAKVGKKRSSIQSWIAPVVAVSIVSATIIGSLLFIIVNQHLLSQRATIREQDDAATAKVTQPLTQDPLPVAAGRAPIQAGVTRQTVPAQSALRAATVPTPVVPKAATLIKAKSLEKQGDAFSRQQKWADAFKMYQQSQVLAESVLGRQNPVILPLVARLAICSSKSHDISSKVSYMNQFADLYSIDPKPMAAQTELLNELGHLYSESKNDALALKLLQVGGYASPLKAEPGSSFSAAVARLELAKTLTRQGQWYDAEAQYQKALASSSAFPKLNSGVRAAYAEFLRRIGRTADAAQQDAKAGPMLPRRRLMER